MVRGTDLDVETTIMLDAKVAPGFSVTVPAKNVKELLRKTKGASDQVHVTAGEDSAAFEFGGGLRVSIAALPVDDFPTLELKTLPHRFEIEAGELHNLLTRVRFAVSSEETRYYLNGIFMHRPNGGRALAFVATDGHRLAKAEIAAPSGSEKIPGVIIPAAAVDELIALCKVKSLAGSVITIKVGEGQVMFTAGRWSILSKLIDGTFPDYQRVIPSGNDKKLIVEKDELVRMIRGVNVVASERGRAIRLSMNGEKLTGSVVNPDTGTASMTIECEYSGEPLDVGFNSAYLLENLEALKGDTVRFRLSDPGSPGLIEGTEDSDQPFLYVLMPMRV